MTRQQYLLIISNIAHDSRIFGGIVKRQNKHGIKMKQDGTIDNECGHQWWYNKDYSCVCLNIISENRMGDVKKTM